MYIYEINGINTIIIASSMFINLPIIMSNKLENPDLYIILITNIINIIMASVNLGYFILKKYNLYLINILIFKSIIASYICLLTSDKKIIAMPDIILLLLSMFMLYRVDRLQENTLLVFMMLNHLTTNEEQPNREAEDMV